MYLFPECCSSGYTFPRLEHGAGILTDRYDDTPTISPCHAPYIHAPLYAPSTGIHTRASIACEEVSSPGRQAPPAFPTSSGVTLRGRARPAESPPARLCRRDYAVAVRPRTTGLQKREVTTRAPEQRRAGYGRPTVAVKRVYSAIRRQGPISSGGDPLNKRAPVELACPQPSWVWIAKATGPSLYSVGTLP